MVEFFYSLSEVISANKKYILSIGRRQPMHIGHKNTLKKLIKIQNELDLQLIYVMGSTNVAGDPLFNPFVNPLNVEQQIKQFQIAFPDTKAIFLSIIDEPDMNQWGVSIIDALNKLNIQPQDCVIHFVGKEEDKLTEDVSFTKNNNETITIAAQHWLIEAIAYYDIAIWFDREIETDLTISARNLRQLDLANLTLKEKALFATPEYLKSLALQARLSNPNKEEKLSLKELTLQRLRIEIR
jgi:hypothetical protein